MGILQGLGRHTSAGDARLESKSLVDFFLFALDYVLLCFKFYLKLHVLCMWLFLYMGLVNLFVGDDMILSL